MLAVSVHSQADVEDGLVRADALISIRGVAPPREPVIDAALFGERVLVLRFDDIPVPAWRDHHGQEWVGPQPSQITDALQFAQRVAETACDRRGRLAVHCLQGRSRSSAVALAVIAQQLGAGREDEAVAQLLAEDEGTVACNPGVIRLADRLLARDGRLEAALERACPRFVTWREFWSRKGVWRGVGTEDPREGN